MPYCNRDPKRDHNFDNHPYERLGIPATGHLEIPFGAWHCDAGLRLDTEQDRIEIDVANSKT